MFILFSSLFLLYTHSFAYVHFSDYLAFPTAVFVGSLVATLISSKNRVLIGVFVGIIFSITTLLIAFKPFNPINDTLFILFLLISSLISGAFGGYTAKKLRKYVIKQNNGIS